MLKNIEEENHYAKSFKQTILQYNRDPENKFEGDTVVLERKQTRTDQKTHFANSMKTHLANRYLS